MRPSALMISSEMPSLKNSFSGSALMFVNGRTAIALSGVGSAALTVTPDAWSRRAASSSRRSSAADW